MLIDDDTELCSLLAEFLTGEGFAVECVHESRRGLERTFDGGFSLAILDVMPPGLDGFIQTLVDAERRLLLDISHELRSPLARLRVAVELARSGQNREAHLDGIDKEAERLNALVGGLLQVTRAEGGPDSLRREPSLDRLLEEVVADSSLEAQARSSEVRLVSAQPVTVQDDAELLRRAIENVIRNAIRHAPEATAVDASLEAANGRAALRIRNYGPGVPDEAPPRIFDAFYRVETDRERASGGAGLGLSIARNAEPGLLVESDLPGTLALAE